MMGFMKRLVASHYISVYPVTIEAPSNHLIDTYQILLPFIRYVNPFTESGSKPINERLHNITKPMEQE